MEPIKHLKKMVIQYGSQKSVAEFLGVTESYISQVISGSSPMTESLADKLGFILVCRWEKK